MVVIGGDRGIVRVGAAVHAGGVGVLVGFIALYLLGSLAGFPQMLLNLEPFAHIPRVGGGDFTAVPLLWLLAIDAALITLGAMAFRRRDVRC